MQRPTREEFERRIRDQLDHRSNSDISNLLWSGYLAALMEWRLLSPDDYHSLREQLKTDGGEELLDIFLGVDRGKPTQQ
jgi:hypothetical protein